MIGGVKAFSQIPGPTSLPVVGTLWSYLPILGPYRFDRMHKNGALRLKKYGPVVKEEIVPGEPVIWIFRPEDVQELLRKEGKYPQRRSHLAIQHLRLGQPHKYRTGGLLPTNGEKWWELRKEFQKGLSPPRAVQAYIPVVNQVIDEFLNYVARTHQSHHDFLDSLSRLFLEILGVVAFHVRLNSFSASELTSTSRTSQLISAAFEANSCILRTDNGPQLWRYFTTPLYSKLRKAHDYMEKVALELIEEVKRRPEQTCLMNTYLNSPHLDQRDALGMAVDMLLAGIDTTAYTSSFALYHLGRHSKEQKKLREEVKTVLQGRDVDAKLLAECHYVKAVVKETLRLNPVSVGVGRLLLEDATFSGYHVPKGTVVVTQSQIVCRQVEWFSNADNFVPERWVKDASQYEQVSPYLLLPFGHGPRTCIARRLAEQNLQILLIKMVERFEIEWAGKVLDVKSLLINKPDAPILLHLKEI